MLDKSKCDKGGLKSLSGPKSFTDLSISSSGTGFGSGSGISFAEVESFSMKSKGRPTAPAAAPPKGFGMQLGKTRRTSQLMQSLQAEGELILDDLPPTVVQTKSSLPPTDPITLAIEEAWDNKEILISCLSKGEIEEADAFDCQDISCCFACLYYHF